MPWTEATFDTFASETIFQLTDIYFFTFTYNYHILLQILTIICSHSLQFTTFIHYFHTNYFFFYLLILETKYKTILEKKNKKVAQLFSQFKLQFISLYNEILHTTMIFYSLRVYSATDRFFLLDSPRGLPTLRFRINGVSASLNNSLFTFLSFLPI